ncbi:MAG: ABC-F family ATP-binding cassette domain-containing protein [Kouleothrix sp.]|nr:ABC-F family ATP-binding cassette domain-containing protein [Kouleothrix sp.]
MTILTLESIAKQFADRPLLEGVSLGVEAGERVGLVGVNGSGKTTLLRIVAGAEQADSGRVTLARGLRVAFLPQNPALDPDLTVIEQIFRGDAPEIRLLRAYEQAAAQLAHAPDDRRLQAAVADLVDRMDAAGAWGLESDARTILGRLGVDELDVPVGRLSGGQRKRVAMARALILPADLLILDEPTNHIDVDTIAWLESFLARSTAALLMVTHDRYFLDRVAGRIVEIDRGRLYSYPGNYSRFVELKAERAEKQAADEARRQTILRKELVWLQRGAQARTTKQQARIDRIEVMRADAPEAQSAALEISVIARRIGKRVIELRGVGKRYGERPLVRDLTLSVEPRDRLGIIGPNGSGKTTLLNMIAGRASPDTGAVVVGETVHIAYYDQESAELDDSQRVIDYVKEGAELVQTGSGATISAAQMLERFLFAPSSHYTPIARLSGGERRRLYLLRTLMAAPNVLLLDEPTNDLDIQTLAVLEDYLDDFAGALIVVSHDRYFLDRTVGRLLVFEGGGAVVEHPGAYSAYAELRSKVAGSKVASSQVASSGIDRSKQKPANMQPSSVLAPKPRKLSFKEARELQELEARIAALEAEQSAIEARINAESGDYQALLQLTADLQRVGADLETAVERWAALAEIAEATG